MDSRGVGGAGGGGGVVTRMIGGRSRGVCRKGDGVGRGGGVKHERQSGVKTFFKKVPTYFKNYTSLL